MQPLLMAMGVSLAKWWTGKGIEPDAVLGLGVGALLSLLAAPLRHVWCPQTRLAARLGVIAAGAFVLGAAVIQPHTTAGVWLTIAALAVRSAASFLS